MTQRTGQVSNLLWIVPSLAAMLVAPLAAQEPLAIKGGRVITMDGRTIENGVVLIREGRISAVGQDLAIPVESRVIDATGKVVMPGFIDVHSSAAMSQANEQNANVPFLSVMDSIDPAKDYFEQSRRNGVTTVAVVPGNATMIGGQSAILKTAGQYVNDMVLNRDAGLKISLRPQSGSRMSHYATLRAELDKAKYDAPEEKPEDKADDEGEADDKESDGTGEASASTPAPTPQVSAAVQRAALKKLLDGTLAAFIYCDNSMDVDQAIELTKQYGLKTRLVLGQNCDKAATQTAESGLPVILDPTLVFWRTDERTGDDEKIVIPKIFKASGIPMTFQIGSASSSTLGSNYLWYQAAMGVKYGMTTDEALRAITLRPAEVLNVEKFVGSIAPGKDADLVILTGDPLKVATWVDKTIVNGQIVYEREKDEKLRNLLEPAQD